MSFAIDMDELEREEQTAFCASEWLRCGRTYKDVPRNVELESIRISTVPSRWLSKLPEEHLSMSETVGRSLPLRDLSFHTTNASTWFSAEGPSRNLTSLFKNSIPPKDTLIALGNAFGQAWFDGAQSIIDPRFESHQCRYPLWALTYWRRASTEVTRYEACLEARNWVRKQSNSPQFR